MLPSIVIFIEILIRSSITVAILFVLNMLMMEHRLSLKEMLILHQAIALSYAVTLSFKSNIIIYVFIYLVCYCTVTLWHAISLGRQKNG